MLKRQALPCTSGSQPWDLLLMGWPDPGEDPCSPVEWWVEHLLLATTNFPGDSGYPTCLPGV